MLNSAISIASDFLANPVISSNATLTFSVASGRQGLTTDEVGNVILAPAAIESVTISCWLRQKKPPYADVQEGSYLDSEYFEGRLVDPKNYPLPIRATGNVTVTIDGRSGVLRQLNVFESPVSGQLQIAEKLGRRIKCYVRFDQGS